MTKYQVIYSKDATDDLKRIYLYIAFVLKAKRTAKSQDARIRKEIRSLSMMPERYRIVEWEPWHSQKVRQVSIDNYVVFYAVNNDNKIVEVVRIYYGGRDIEELINNP